MHSSFTMNEKNFSTLFFDPRKGLARRIGMAKRSWDRILGSVGLWSTQYLRSIAGMTNLFFFFQILFTITFWGIFQTVSCRRIRPAGHECFPWGRDIPLGVLLSALPSRAAFWSRSVWCTLVFLSVGILLENNNNKKTNVNFIFGLRLK